MVWEIEVEMEYVVVETTNTLWIEHCSGLRLVDQVWRWRERRLRYAV